MAQHMPFLWFPEIKAVVSATNIRSDTVCASSDLELRQVPAYKQLQPHDRDAKILLLSTGIYQRQLHQLF